MGIGVNDTSILVGLISFFFLIAIVSPFIANDFNQNLPLHDVQLVDEPSTTGWDIFFSLFTIWFWTFGTLPVIVDALMFIPRIALIVLIVKIIRGVGG